MIVTVGAWAVFQAGVGMTAGISALSTAAQVTGTISDHLDHWASPANTLLLIFLYLLTRSGVGKAKEQVQLVADKIDETHISVANAASAAASAASSAADAARITKELGGAARSVEPPKVTNGEDASAVAAEAAVVAEEAAEGGHK